MQRKKTSSAPPALLNEGKPEKMVDKIVEGRMAKYFEEVCLYEQPFVKENTITIDQLIKTKIAKLGENIASLGALPALKSATPSVRKHRQANLVLRPWPNTETLLRSSQTER